MTVCVCVCVCACVRACVRACARACARGVSVHMTVCQCVPVGPACHSSHGMVCQS